jgi:hypothetical protein
LFTFLFVCVNPNEKEMTKCICCVCVYEYSVCCGSLTFQRERENNIQGGPNSVLFGPRPKGKEHNIEPWWWWCFNRPTKKKSFKIFLRFSKKHFEWRIGFWLFFLQWYGAASRSCATVTTERNGIGHFFSAVCYANKKIYFFKEEKKKYESSIPCAFYRHITITTRWKRRPFFCPD